MSTKILRENSTVTSNHVHDYFVEKPSELKMIDYDHLFTSFTKSKAPNYSKHIRDEVFNIQGRAFRFSSGTPNPETFPYEEVAIKLKTGDWFQVKGKQLMDSLGYLTSNGYQPLMELLKDQQDRFHGNQDWKKKDLTTTTGIQGGLHQVLEMFVAPGEPVIVQSPFYTGVISVLHPLKVEYIEVESGREGICTQRLANTLRERQKQNLPMPKIFYLNPTGCNPTGEIISTERKKQLYKIACEYNLLIIEDDPYFLITYNLNETPISFLSMDTENRVVRFDTISKIIGAGFRLGYVTAAKEVIAKLNLVKESSNYCAPFSQIVVYETLKSMRFDGFVKHVNSIRNFYHENCKAVIKSLDKHLKDVATWRVPEAAMFVWLTIKDIDHISDRFIDKCLSKLVFIVPGFAFYGGNRLSPCIRLAFSMVNEEEIEEGIELLARLIKEELLAYKMNKRSILTE